MIAFKARCLIFLFFLLVEPQIVSPLSHLPSPHKGTGGMHQRLRLLTEPRGNPNVTALAEVLTTKCYDFRKPCGIGIFLEAGDDHRSKRKALAPAFSLRHIKNLYKVFWDKSHELVNAMTDQLSCKEKEQQNTRLACDESPPSTGVLDIAEWANRATLDMIGIAGMGRDLGQSTTRTRTCAIFLAILRLLLSNWLVNRLPLRRNKEIERAVRTIRGVCAELIHQKPKYLSENSNLEHRDILSVALQNGGFSEEGLIDQLVTFLAAGHETTATAFTWAIYLLCQSPDDHKSSFTYQSIDSMTYLHAAPPVPFTIREAVADTVILNQPTPKDTKIMVVSRATNRDAHLWGPDAQDFKPKRWLKPDARSNYATVIFIHGPRSRIGQSSAKAEFAILLAALVGRSEFQLEVDRLLDERRMKVTRTVTARPVNGLLVKATPLVGW
ncbi:cytochrome P450 [Aspergillus eucalypticola CBS 122712]|uniref:Cytochrome P450 n=1 Tax=Aspergillus eucalypticola (strain CBS 122712 / IBT 29274) TaxID=1448314 RepID=A0A317VVC2_ASPEC|nr:cytochrome P450 [Aspergillus eucalypticola CBS 122712]PWY76927.1 cytochrome P450 [Aspergillus eucalypticola CBS 122712]